MGYFPVRYDSRVVIYDCKMFIRLAAVYDKPSKIYSTCMVTIHTCGQSYTGSTIVNYNSRAVPD